MAKKKRLGDMLLEKGLIDEFQLEAALGKQRQWGGRLGTNLVKLGFIDEITLVKFLSSQLKLPRVDLARINFSHKVYSLIPGDIAKKHLVIPLEIKDDLGKKALYIAMSEPTNMEAMDEIQFLTGYTVKPVIATETQLSTAIEKYYDDKGWLRIEPLSDEPKFKGTKGALHEAKAKEGRDEQKAGGVKNPELLALLRVLVKKGLVTRGEYLKELKEVRD